jgi:hypothetical protein
MDATIESDAGEEISQTAWRNSFKEFLRVKEKFGPALSRLQIRLPYGHYGKLTPILEESGAIFGAVEPEIFEQNYNLGLAINYTTLTFRRVETSKGTSYKVFLEQIFPGKVIDTFIDKRSGFRYSWNSRKVTIKRYLNTTSADVVANQLDVLLDECTRFHLMYCDN